MNGEQGVGIGDKELAFPSHSQFPAPHSPFCSPAFHHPPNRCGEFPRTSSARRINERVQIFLLTRPRPCVIFLNAFRK